MPGPEKNYYKPLILLLLFAFLVFSGWSAWQASTPGSQVTDREYYSKGLKYNATLVEKHAAEVLGWVLTTEIEDKTLVFQLEDSDQLAVSGATGTLLVYLPKSPDGQAFPLHESSPGTYIFSIPSELTGTLRARLTFTRDGATLNRQLQLNL